MKIIILDENELKERLKELGIIGDKPERKECSWPHKETFRAFKAFPEADTITVDPHKLGYVLYPAGGFAMKDKRMRNAIHTFAPYVFKKPKPGEPDDLIGSYILEGSKPGAAAAAVWTTHQIMPLNITGFGKLIGETIDGAQALYFALSKLTNIVVNDSIKINVYPITKPDINIVNYVFNFEGNKSLKKMNKLTGYIAEKIFGPDPVKNQTMLQKSFIVSSTELSKHEYGNSPLGFVKKLGFSREEWEKVQSIKVIRSVIMSPYLTTDFVDDNYVLEYSVMLRQELKKHCEQINLIFSVSDK